MLGKTGKFTGKVPWKRIGIAGVSHGNGTTFCAMMAACFLAKVKKQKTALVERNFSGHLWQLGKAAPCFSVHGIDIYGKNTQDIKAFDSYPYVILDYGTKIREGAGLLPEFSRCDIKIITICLCEWKQEEFFQFADAWSSFPESGDFIYFAPFAQQNDVRAARKRVSQNIYPLAAEKNWSRIGSENLKLLEYLLC